MTATFLSPTPLCAPSPAFALEVESFTDAVAVLRVYGEVDMLTAPQLREQLDTLLRTVAHVEMDLAGVTFFSTAGIDIVTSTYARHGDKLEVFAPTRPARQVLDMFAPPALTITG